MINTNSKHEHEHEEVKVVLASKIQVSRSKWNLVKDDRMLRHLECHK